MLTISTNLNTKELRQLIMMLLRSNLAIEIKKLNYISSYKKDENNQKKINKTQEKLLLINFEESKKEKLISLISKQKNISIIELGN